MNDATITHCTETGLLTIKNATFAPGTPVAYVVNRVEVFRGVAGAYSTGGDYIQIWQDKRCDEVLARLVQVAS